MTFELTFLHGLGIGFALGVLGRKIVIPFARRFTRRTPSKADDLALDLIDGIAESLEGQPETKGSKSEKQKKA